VKSNHLDTLFRPDQGELAKPIACLIHPTQRGLHNYKVTHCEGFDTVTYSLCSFCNKKLGEDPTYKIHVDKTITKRLNDLAGGE
jgi:hypothetical protein